jgi:hypothetical protein
MQFIPADRRTWLPELSEAVNAVREALAGRVPTPELLFQLVPEIIDTVSGHRLILKYYEFGYLFDPEMDEPGTPECAILISGNRLQVGWLIKAEELGKVFG